MSATQLKMIHRRLATVPRPRLPDGWRTRTYQPGDEKAWARIMNSGIGQWDVESVRLKLTEMPQFDPEGLFFAVCGDEVAGSACAWRGEGQGPQQGTLHMVCVLPQWRGLGLGRALCAQVLCYFKDHDVSEVILTTDDERLPAIRSYLSLGFEPVVSAPADTARWEAVKRNLSRMPLHGAVPQRPPGTD